MTPYERRSNAYVQRMADDMRIRNFADSTINTYTYHVDKFFTTSASPRKPSVLSTFAIISSIWSMSGKFLGVPLIKPSVPSDSCMKSPWISPG